MTHYEIELEQVKEKIRQQLKSPYLFPRVSDYMRAYIRACGNDFGIITMVSEDLAKMIKLGREENFFGKYTRKQDDGCFQEFTDMINELEKKEKR